MKHRLARAFGPLLLVAAAVAVLVSTASMLAGLRHAFGRKRREPEDARERVRRALAPMLVELDPKVWGDWLEPLPDDFDDEAFRRSMPLLDPPLSQTIVEDRESSRD